MIFLGDEMSFIIRDVIHNDIEFDDKIKQILSCSEFQRLHRIHQLSSYCYSHKVFTFYRHIPHYEKSHCSFYFGAKKTWIRS